MSAKRKPANLAEWWPLGVAEAAEYLGVKAGTVSQWKLRGKMPPADGQVGRDDAWYPATLDEWQRSGRANDAILSDRPNTWQDGRKPRRRCKTCGKPKTAKQVREDGVCYDCQPPRMDSLRSLLP